MKTISFEDVEIRCCNDHSRCVGSLDGLEFLYADGSKDFGQLKTIRRVYYRDDCREAMTALRESGFDPSCWDSSKRVVIGMKRNKKALT